MNAQTLIAGAAVLAAAAGHAAATITITQGASGATYGTTLNFDEPGTPTGIVPIDTWAGIGLERMEAGDGQSQVFDPTEPWIGSGNSFLGVFGVFMTFSTDLTSFSGQVWDPSGPPTFIGGGFGVFVFNDGVEVGFYSGEPAWGGLGDSWIDVTATDGMVFDEVRILGFGFFPTTYVDNLSWNAVPAPGSLALLGLAGFATGRRRR
jgi:hypothetical protein